MAFACLSPNRPQLGTTSLGQWSGMTPERQTLGRHAADRMELAGLDDVLSLGCLNGQVAQARDLAAGMNGVGIVSFGGDASGDLDLSHVSVDLDGDHVVAGRSDLTADGDCPDVRARLDAERDRLERDLDALDNAWPSPPSVVRSPEISNIGRGLLT